jgi:hypothetical protein
VEDKSHKDSKIYRYLLGLGTIFLIVACLGGGISFLGYTHAGKFLAAIGIILGILCIVAFWIVRLLWKKQTLRDETGDS